MVGAKIREVRQRQGLTLKSLAALSGFSKSTLIYWESGKRSPREEDLKKLAEVLGVPVVYFLTDASSNQSMEFTPLSEVVAASNCLVYEANGKRISVPATKDGYEFFWKFIESQSEK